MRSSSRLQHWSLLTFLGLLLPLVACSHAPTTNAGGNQSSAKGSGGTLIIGMTADNVPIPDTPPDQGFEGRRFVGFQIYDGLTKFNLNQGDTTPTPQPDLATSWDVAPDKLTWTFHLRPGVKFTDGTDFDADAAVFQLDRILNKTSPYFNPDLYAANLSNTFEIASYRAVDPMTLEIKTKEPYAWLTWETVYINFPSPAAVQKYGKSYPDHAVGTGPFKIDKYVDRQEMELVPNADYWSGKPKLDRLILKPMPDPATRLAALQSGEINWAEVPPPDSKKELQSQGYQILLKSYPHTIDLFLNTYSPPFDNPKVREALQYAIDRDGMCNNLLDGLCTPADQYAYTGHPWDDPSLPKLSYDPKKAKQLLAEAGYPNGFKTTIAYPTGGSGNMWPGPMMELIQRNFKEAGVDLTLEPMEWNNIITIYRSGLGNPAYSKYGGFYFSAGVTAPSSLLNFVSWRIPPAGCCNNTGYSNPQVDELAREAQAEFDPKKDDALLRQAFSIVAVDSPSLWVVHDLNFRVLSPKVHGFVQPQSWFADLTSAWVSN